MHQHTHFSLPQPFRFYHQYHQLLFWISEGMKSPLLDPHLYEYELQLHKAAACWNRAMTWCDDKNRLRKIEIAWGAEWKQACPSPHVADHRQVCRWKWNFNVYALNIYLNCSISAWWGCFVASGSAEQEDGQQIEDSVVKYVYTWKMLREWYWLRAGENTLRVPWNDK